MEPPFSNFDWVDSHYRGEPAIRRLFSQARTHKASSIIIEDLPHEGMVAEEDAEISSIGINHSTTGLQRISFWRAPQSTVEQGEAESDDLVGFAILKQDTVKDAKGKILSRWHVFESVFIKHPHEHNYVPHVPQFCVVVSGKKFSIAGVLYCQQNGLNKACAQVALRSVLAPHLPDRDISCTTINSIARTVHNFDASKGLDSGQIRKVLETLGCAYTDIDYGALDDKARDDFLYQKLLYAGIESGDGALLGFELQGPEAKGARHIIPFFGHTFNMDTWVPYAENDYFHVGDATRFLPSEAWVNSFIGHDDNFGSNFCVPRQYIKSSQVQYVALIHKRGFASSGIEAEAVAVEYLYSILPHANVTKNDWAGRLLKCVVKQQVVLRALPLSREDYVVHLGNSRDWQERAEYKYIVEAMEASLPERVWMIEVSLPELFAANKRKVGCILLDGSKPLGTKLDFSSFLFARLPATYLFFKSHSSSKGPSFEARQSNLKSHIKLLIRN